jgi:hypothetical protein
MNREQLQEFIGRKPFVPFEISLSNGEVHQIRHPENAMLLRTVLIVGYPESDRAVQCTVHHINAAETIHHKEGTGHENGQS